MKNENIGDILARRLRSRGLDRAVLAAMVCGEADKVGEGDFRAVSFKGGALKIHVSSNARANLIKLREKDLISKINLKFKKNLVERLKFEIS
jgi:hypothetical protein